MNDAQNLQTTDARVWAQSFMLLTADAEIDEGLMIGWFANAIEWAKNHERRQLREAGIDLDHRLVFHHTDDFGSDLYERDPLEEA